MFANYRLNDANIDYINLQKGVAIVGNYSKTEA